MGTCARGGAAPHANNGVKKTVDTGIS